MVGAFNYLSHDQSALVGWLKRRRDETYSGLPCARYLLRFDGTTFCLLPIGASATFLTPGSHQYLEQEYDNTIDGGFFQNVSGQEDLINPNQFAYDSVNNQPSFIDKEMWLNMGNPSSGTTCAFGTSYCWIETGDTVGGIGTQQGGIGTQQSLRAWAGHFFAISKNDGTYYEEPIGTNGVTGAHSFEIAYGVNGIWEIYIDGTLTRQISSMSAFRWGFNLQAGLESDNTDNSFTNGTYQDSLQWRNNGWNYWDVSPHSNDNLTYIANAHSTYAYGADPTITFGY